MKSSAKQNRSPYVCDQASPQSNDGDRQYDHDVSASFGLDIGSIEASRAYRRVEANSTISFDDTSPCFGLDIGSTENARVHSNERKATLKEPRHDYAHGVQDRGTTTRSRRAFVRQISDIANASTGLLSEQSCHTLESRVITVDPAGSDEEMRLSWLSRRDSDSQDCDANAEDTTQDSNGMNASSDLAETSAKQDELIALKQQLAHLGNDAARAKAHADVPAPRRGFVPEVDGRALEDYTTKKDISAGVALQDYIQKARERMPAQQSGRSPDGESKREAKPSFWHLLTQKAESVANASASRESSAKAGDSNQEGEADWFSQDLQELHSRIARCSGKPKKSAPAAAKAIEELRQQNENLQKDNRDQQTIIKALLQQLDREGTSSEGRKEGDEIHPSASTSLEDNSTLNFPATMVASPQFPVPRMYSGVSAPPNSPNPSPTTTPRTMLTLPVSPRRVSPMTPAVAPTSRPPALPCIPSPKAVSHALPTHGTFTPRGGIAFLNPSPKAAHTKLLPTTFFPSVPASPKSSTPQTASLLSLRKAGQMQSSPHSLRQPVARSQSNVVLSPRLPGDFQASAGMGSLRKTRPSNLSVPEHAQSAASPSARTLTPTTRTLTQPMLTPMRAPAQLGIAPMSPGKPNILPLGNQPRDQKAA